MERTAAEATIAYVDLMGADLGALYAELWQETARLHALWEEFVELFGVSPGRIDLLNDSAPTFFRKVENTFWEAVLLGICRLTDPPKSARRSNLTIRRLARAISDATLRGTIEDLVQRVIDQSAFCRDWRNRRIAHGDLDLAIGAPAKPLESGSRADVNRVLDSLTAVLNAVSSHFDGTTSIFRSGPSVGGVEMLLHTLMDGQKAHAARLARVKAGQPLGDDLHPPNLP